MRSFFLTRLWIFWTQIFPDCLLPRWPVFAAKYLLCILGLNLGYRLDPVLVAFSLCSDKILNKSNSKKGRITLAQSFRVWKEGLEAGARGGSSHFLLSQEAEEDRWQGSAGLLFSIWSRSTFYRMELPTPRVTLSISTQPWNPPTDVTRGLFLRRFEIQTSWQQRWTIRDKLTWISLFLSHSFSLPAPR